MQPAVNTRGKAITAGALVGASSFFWYSRHFLWLGVVMGLIAGLLTFFILSTNRMERVRRTFFIALFVLTFGALAVIVLDMGFKAFMYWIEIYELAYYLPNASPGINNVPNVLVIPQVFLGKAEFVSEIGLWQAPFPKSLDELLLVLMPYLIISLMFGRAFCGWLCPFGGLPEAMTIGKKQRWQLNFLKKQTATTRGFRFAGLKGWVNSTKYGLLFTIVLLSLLMPFPLVFVFSLPLWWKSIPIFWTLIGILVVFAIVLPFMTKRRWWCQICPVGAIMSLLHKISLFRVRIDEKKCTRCMVCIQACHMYALTSDDVNNALSSDAAKGTGGPNAQCIRCGRCMGACPREAMDISFIGRYKTGRTPFIALAIATAFASYVWFIVFLASFSNRAGF